MSIQEISLNFKHFLKNSDVQVAGVFIFVAVGSFLFGRASVVPKSAAVERVPGAAAVIETTQGNGLSIPTEEEISGTASSLSGLNQVIEGGYVASKSGAKYHLPWCSGAQRIKEENKVWFATKEEAESAGYEPAANCKGI